LSAFFATKTRAPEFLAPFFEVFGFFSCEKVGCRCFRSGFRGYQLFLRRKQALLNFSHRFSKLSAFFPARNSAAGVFAPVSGVVSFFATKTGAPEFLALFFEVVRFFSCENRLQLFSSRFAGNEEGAQGFDLAD
jgi:hypothetical protein